MSASLAGDSAIPVPYARPALTAPARAEPDPPCRACAQPARFERQYAQRRCDRRGVEKGVAV